MVQGFGAAGAVFNNVSSFALLRQKCWIISVFMINGFYPSLRKTGFAACLLAVGYPLTLIAAGGALAQQKQPAAKLAPAAKKIPMPDQYKVNLLIRTTLIAFSQANETGNYSVLRDLSSPRFQLLNSHARLVEVFEKIRQRKLDLSPIIFYTPKLVRAPALQKDGLLRTTGYFDTKPERVHFDLGFRLIRNQWRLEALIVDVKRPGDKVLQVAPADTVEGQRGKVGTAKKPGPKAVKQPEPPQRKSRR